MPCSQSSGTRKPTSPERKQAGGSRERTRSPYCSQSSATRMRRDGIRAATVRERFFFAEEPLPYGRGSERAASECS